MNHIKRCVAVLLFLPLIHACTTTEETAAKEEKQNIVLIMIDDLRPVLGAYSDEKAITPHIDALAQQGVTFKQAYTNVPVCGASRASMMTGLRPTPTRFIDYKAKAENDVPGAKSLPQVLKEAGYYTMGIGKLFHNGKDLAEESWSEKLQSSGMPHGTTLNPESKILKNPKHGKGPWYEYADVTDNDYPDGKVKLKALTALSKLAKQEQPFFLGIGFIRPHLPFNAPKKYYDIHPEEKFSPFYLREKPNNAPESLKGSGEINTYHFRGYTYNSDAFHTASLRGYYASVSYVDSLVGAITQQIKDLGLSDNTTIVLTSDHGFNLGEFNFWTKHTVLDTSLRIPLIVAGPQFPKNQQTDALVELIDIFPTVAEITQVTPPETIDGVSFVDVLKQPELKHKSQIYSRFKAADSIVTDDFIFSSYTVGDNEVEEMLYDHIKDPHETNNVVNDPSYRQQAAKFRALLADCVKNQNCVTQ